MFNIIVFIIKIFILYQIIYFAVKHARIDSNGTINPIKEEDEQISLFIELRDMGIIDNIEVERIIWYKESLNKQSIKDKKLQDCISLMNELRDNGIIEFENFESKIHEIEDAFHNQD